MVPTQEMRVLGREEGEEERRIMEAELQGGAMR